MSSDRLSKLRQDLNNMTLEERKKFKEERQSEWQNYSLKSSFFGVSYIVLIPFLLMIFPLAFTKSLPYIIISIFYTLIVIYTEKKYGSIKAFKRKLGLRYSKYKLNRTEHFGRMRKN